MNDRPTIRSGRNRSAGAALALLGAIVLLVGCGDSANRDARRPAGFAESSGNDEVMRDHVFAPAVGGLTVTLSAEPEVTLGEREEVGVHVAITNDGPEAVLLDALAARLRIDGQRALQLDLAARGLSRIAPGQTAEFDENLRVRLLEPGDHVFQLDIGDDHSAPIHVLVRE